MTVKTPVRKEMQQQQVPRRNLSKHAGWNPFTVAGRKLISFVRCLQELKFGRGWLAVSANFKQASLSVGQESHVYSQDRHFSTRSYQLALLCDQSLPVYSTISLVKRAVSQVNWLLPSVVCLKTITLKCRRFVMLVTFMKHKYITSSLGTIEYT